MRLNLLVHFFLFNFFLQRNERKLQENQTLSPVPVIIRNDLRSLLREIDKVDFE